MRRQGRIDVVQPEMVRRIREAYWSAQILSAVGGGCPDLLAGGNVPCGWCGRPNKGNVLIEAKSEDGKMTPDQLVWHLDWRGQIAIARNVDEVLKILGIGR
jgi:hypothetical protein